MERDELLKFIRQTGYRTLSEIQAQFREWDGELLTMNLTFLLDKNSIKKVPYRCGPDERVLYYIHPNCSE